MVNTPNTVPKLTKKNYAEWCIHMGILFRARNLWQFLDDEDDDDETETIPQITKRQKRDIADLIYPVLSAEVKELLALDQFKDGVSLWQDLKKALTTAGKRQYINLQREQRALQYSDTGIGAAH